MSRELLPEWEPSADLETAAGKKRRVIGHAPVCRWDEVHPETGKRWQDMWGGDEFVKKMNFFLHVRGLLVPKASWAMGNGAP
jgi:hypothetical protein